MYPIADTPPCQAVPRRSQPPSDSAAAGARAARLKAFGENLRAKRQDLGLTQAELAERAGTTRAVVVAAERATRAIGLDVALALVEAVDGHWVIPRARSRVVRGDPD